MNAKPNSILVYRLGSLGDTVVALPALHWLRTRFPAANITLLTNSPINGKATPASTLLASTGLLNDYLVYPVGTRDPVTLFRLGQNIGRRGFEIVFTLSEARGRAKSLRDWLFFRCCGIPKVVGLPLRHEDVVCVSESNGHLHEPEANRLLRRIGAESQVNLEEDRWWDLRLSAQERRAADGLLMENGVLGRFLAFSVGTKFEVNNWTLPNWSELIEGLGRRHGHIPLVGLGVEEERHDTEALLGRWPGCRVNLCGSLSPRISAAVLKKAAVFIGHDSGPMHLASAVGTRCVAIFSGRNPPGQWFPRGPGHHVLFHRTECCGCGLAICHSEAKKCILSISVDEVEQAVEKALQELGSLSANASRLPMCTDSLA